MCSAAASYQMICSRPRSLAEATLDAAQVNAAPSNGDFLHFYGPHRSFHQIPFWYVLDSDPWTRQLDGGRFFEDKIVLIGATADRFQDFHQAPFSETLLHPEAMAGVEILATDVATLRAGVALRRGIYQPWMRAAFVLLTGAGFGVLLWRVNRPIARLAWTVATASIWFWLSFGIFVLAGYVLACGGSHPGLCRDWGRVHCCGHCDRAVTGNNDCAKPWSNTLHPPSCRKLLASKTISRTCSSCEKRR